MTRQDYEMIMREVERRFKSLVLDTDIKDLGDFQSAKDILNEQVKNKISKEKARLEWLEYFEQLVEELNDEFLERHMWLKRELI